MSEALSTLAGSGGRALMQELLSVLTNASPEQREKLQKAALDATKHMRWVPNPGPQTMGYNCSADQVFYGGEVGGGKTDLAIGLALQKHRDALLLRRLNKETPILIDRTERILGTRQGFNGTNNRWRRPTSQCELLQFGGCQNPGDERGYKGGRKDFIGIDEAAEFLESQVEFLAGWIGSIATGQHCQLFLGSNPPANTAGLWIIRWFAPWLDPTHPLFPYPDGKLLWCFSVQGTDPRRFEWFATRPEDRIIDGKLTSALSRTFIRSELKDNPELAASGYGERIGNTFSDQNRRLFRQGDFTASMGDDQMQVIPTQWVLAAQQRWTPLGGKVEPMTAMGLDPAGGGRDSAELIVRHGGWYGMPVTAVGEETADGSKTAGMVVQHRRAGAPVVVDVGGGYASGVLVRFKDNTIPYVAYNGAGASTVKTRDKSLGFHNKRAEAWWKFREELDPDQEGGSIIALPPVSELLGDLTCVRIKHVDARGILLESKDDIRKRLGRSPGKGDAVVMAMSEGTKARLRMQDHTGYSFGEQGLSPDSGRPKVVQGHMAVRRALGRV